jgi:hypothetical protein
MKIVKWLNIEKNTNYTEMMEALHEGFNSVKNVKIEKSTD